MAYRIAGIDIHKKVVAVVIADMADEEYEFERRAILEAGTNEVQSRGRKE
jgi:hypothetical protein